jgi:PPE-repeat protein
MAFGALPPEISSGHTYSGPACAHEDVNPERIRSLGSPNPDGGPALMPSDPPGDAFELTRVN